MNRLLSRPFALGAIVAVATQLIVPTGWWLNSARGMRMTSLVLFGLAAAVAFSLPRLSTTVPADPGTRPSTVAPIVLLWCGVMAGLAATLFTLGPGSIFPIVLAISGALSAVFMAAGAGAGLGLRFLARGLTRRAPLSGPP